VLDDLGRKAMTAVAERSHADILSDTPLAPDRVSVTMPFVHISALERSGLTALNEGERVSFNVVDGRKGLEASRVRLV
jgi:hypothetical protein